jgi:hypothetical protein
MLEFTREEHRYQHFVNGTLDGHNRDKTKNSMGRVPKLEEPLHRSGENDQPTSARRDKKTYEELKKSDHSDCAKNVGNSCHDCAKPHAARVEQWPKGE